ncbi:unnamed protein product [Pylaiella littoralis]
MTWQKVKQRGSSAAHLCHRRILLLAGAATLAGLLSSCQAEESININNNQREEIVAAEVVDNDGGLDDPNAPEMAPIEDFTDGTTTDDVVEDEEEVLCVPAVSTPSVALDQEEKGEDGSTASASFLGADPAVEEAAAAAEAAALSITNTVIVDPDPPAADVVTFGAGTADTVDTADGAAGAAGPENGSQQHDPDAGDGGNGEGGGGGGGEAVHVSSELDGVGNKSTTESATGFDALANAMDDDEWGGTGRPEESTQDEDEGAPDVETKEEVKVVRLPTAADGDREGDKKNGGDVVNGHGNVHEVVASGVAELSVSTAVSFADGHRHDGHSESTIRVVGGGADADRNPAAAVFPALAAEGEEQQQPRQPMSSSTSGTGLSLDAQASVAPTAAAAAAATSVQGSDAAAASAPTAVRGNDLELNGDGSSSSNSSSTSSSHGDEDGGGAADGVPISLSQSSFGVTAGSAATVADREPQKPERPGDVSSSSTTAEGITSATVVADKDDVRPSRAEEAPHGGGDVGGMSGSAADRARSGSGSKKADRRPEGAEEKTEATAPSNHGSNGGGSNGSGGGRALATGHERHGGDVVGRGENSGEVEGGSEDANRSGGGGGHGGGTDIASGAGSGGGGRGGGTEFPRGSPEELAQRVRDMEAELVRKLLAEEDAKSLLDIWVEKAREYILTQTVPPTDAECDFSWSRLRCEPKCSCGARLRFGDYTPGRACRLLHPWERSPDLCSEGGEADAWDPSDEPALGRAVAAAAGALGRLRRAYEARVAPPSDPECTFSLEARRCEPQPQCRLRLRWGDVTLTSGCRLVAVPEEQRPPATIASAAAATASAAGRHENIDGSTH